MSAGAGAGTTPAVTVTGNDTAGLLTVTTGSAPAASSAVATVTFATAYGAAPKAVLLTPANAAAAALSGGSAVWEDQPGRTASGFALRVGANGLASSTTYLFNYHVLG